MKKNKEGGCLEAIGELLLEIVLFAVGAGVLALLGIGLDSENIDPDLITLIGVAAVAVAGLLIFLAVRLFKRKKSCAENSAENSADIEENNQ